MARRGPPPYDGPCRHCGRPQADQPDGVYFVGTVCSVCRNARRRFRYRHDPEHRRVRRVQSNASYDRLKQRQRMRDYRAAKKLEREATPEGA